MQFPKIKNIYNFAKGIYQSAKGLKPADLVKARSLAQREVARIPESSWQRMTENVFRQKNETVPEFLDNIRFIRSLCMKTDEAIPEDIAKSLSLLEQKSELFVRCFNRSISRGIEPKNYWDYATKFRNAHSEHIDKVQNFTEKLLESVNKRWREAARTDNKGLYKTLQDDSNRMFNIYRVFRFPQTEDLVNLKIVNVSDEIIHSGQTFYHGTKHARAIKKKGFSLLPKGCQAAQGARELGEGIYLTPSKKVASHYAGLFGNVMHLNVDLKSVAAVNNSQLSSIQSTITHTLQENGIKPTPAIMEQVIKELFIRNGYNAVYSREALGIKKLFAPDTRKIVDALCGGRQTQLVVFNPNDITILNKSVAQRLQNSKNQVIQFFSYPFQCVKGMKNALI